MSIDSSPRNATSIVTAIAPLRHHDFRLVWVCSFLLNLGLWSQNVSATWWMVGGGHSAGLIAAVQFALTAPGVVLAIAAGVLCDIFGWKRILMLASAVISVAVLPLIWLEHEKLLQPAMVVLLTGLVGCGATMRQPALQVSNGLLVPRKLLLEAVALDSFNLNVSRCIGPTFGGIVVMLGGVEFGFLTALLLSLPSIVLLSRVQGGSVPPRGTWPKLRGLLKDSVKSCLTDRLLRSSCVLAFAFGTCGQSVWVIIPVLFATERLGSAAVYGGVLAFIGAGAVAGAVIRSPLQVILSHQAALVMALLLAGIAPAVIFFHGAIRLLCIALFLFGVAWSTMFSTINYIVQVRRHDRMKGQILSYYLAAMYLGYALGSWLWGRTSELFGASEAAIVAVVGFGLILVWVVLGLSPALRALQTSSPIQPQSR
jgi:predicted MFS family arabinose efflux permease